MSLIDDIAAAIQKQEGWYPGSLSYRNNNPGNLRSWGSTPIVNGYAQFATYQDGLDALKRQISLNINRGLTLNEFFAGKPGVYSGYAPSEDSNRPYEYAANVGGAIGIPVDVPLNNVAGNLPVQAPTPTQTEFSSVDSYLPDVSSFADMSIPNLSQFAPMDGGSLALIATAAMGIGALVWMIFK